MPDQDVSDLDVDVLIPKFGELCHQAESKTSHSLGNLGDRPVYYENMIYKCFLESLDPAIHDQAKDVKLKRGDLIKSFKSDKAFGKFIRKWTKKLKRPDKFFGGNSS